MKLNEKRKSISQNIAKSLIELICVINGISYNTYMRTTNMFSDGICLKDPMFMELSSIDWLSMKPLDHSNIIFKIKFLTILFSKLLGRDNTMGKSFAKNYDILSSDGKQKMMCDTSIDMFSTCYQTVTDVLNNQPWNLNIMKLNKLAFSTIRHKKYDEVSDYINYIVNELHTNTKYDILTGRFFDNGMVTYQILLMSYIMITGDLSFDRFISGRKFNGLNIDEDISWLLYKYGKNLRKYLRHNKKKVNPLFNAYMEANPLVCTNSIYGTNSDIALVYTALGFVGFMLNDKTINTYLHHIMNKRIKFTDKLPEEKPMDIVGFINSIFWNR